MTFSFKRTEYKGNIVKYSLIETESNTAISYHDFLENLKSRNASLRTALTAAIKNQILPDRANGFFWECVPTSLNTYATTHFEFVLIPTTFNGKMDRNSFSGKTFHATEQTTTFKNTHADADLVIPTQNNTADSTDFYHLRSFLKTASDEQINALWKKVGETLDKCLKSPENPTLWLSTHGHGVNWLHVRLDTQPKYYHFAAFKNSSIVPHTSKHTAHTEKNDKVSGTYFYLRCLARLAVVAGGVALVMSLLLSMPPVFAVAGLTSVGIGFFALNHFSESDNRKTSALSLEAI